MGGSACPFGRFSGIAADPPVFFFVEKRFPPLTFREIPSIITWYELKKERMGALQARREPSETAPGRGTHTGGDAVEGGSRHVLPPPADMEGERADEDPARYPCGGGGDPGVDLKMEGGESAYQGVERLHKVNPSVFCPEETENWGQYTYRFIGRPPAEQPDYLEALKAFRGFIEPFRHVLNPLLVGLVGERVEENCAYSSLTLHWTVILGFFLRRNLESLLLSMPV